MSTNTLRGIGQGEDGDGDATASGKAVANAAAAPGGAAGGAAVEDVVSAAGDLTERMPERHSLDSPIPGTRSLDSSVPDAPPSLDAKVPHLAATLMGVMAPTVSGGNRDKGIVQEREVHSPAESQRLSGGRPDGDGASAAGSGPVRWFDQSEPTRADPVRTAALAHEVDDRGGRGSGAVRTIDSNSHGPWYDQDPTNGDEVYEDEKPSVVGRAAIGVAVAAGLSVVVFGVLRMTANSDEGDRRPPAALYEPSSQPAGPAAPGSASSAAAQLPTGEPSAAAAPGEGPARAEATSANKGTVSHRASSGSGGPAATAAGPSGGATVRPTVARVGPAGPRSTARAVTAARPPPAGGSSRVGTASPGSAVISAPPSLFNAPSDIVVPTPPVSPTAGKSAASGGTDKARGKPYDPDSTLPLNLD